MVRGGLIEVGKVFLKLGLISFGGPVAHLGYFHSELVHKRRWMDDAAYADLVALCQFLPGPASSQVAFGLGMHRARLAGALIASVAFLFPSAVVMIAFADGVVALGASSGAGWIAGLKVAAVAVVAQAVWTMGRRLCPDAPRIILCITAAAILLLVQSTWMQLGVIAGGALVGWLYYRNAIAPSSVVEAQSAGHHRAAIAALILFVILLLALPFLARSTGNREIAVFDGSYRSGAFVFGGGHVVLPLLRAEVVPPGWVTDDAFLAGYGAAQAIPGPLFSFAGYLAGC